MSRSIFTRARTVFVISVFLACSETISKGYVFQGQGQFYGVA